jgi:protein TonB
MTRRTSLVLVAWCLSLGVTLEAAAQDSISSARDLYASAAYEDALAVLNRIPSGQRSADDTRAIEQYKAFCLLALGRTSEAERSIESLVSEQPMYHGADADMSPRVRSAFADVRRRMLPTLIQKRYNDAKGAYDRKEFSAAAQGFQQALEMMADPDLAPVLVKPPLSDIRMLASGFHDLSVSALPPPPLPSTPVSARSKDATPEGSVAPGSAAPRSGPISSPAAAPKTAASAPPPPVPAAAPAPAPARGAMRIYASTDPSVVPPITLRQELPSFPGQVMIQKQGVIEVVIDESGFVETAVMRVPVSPAYDSLALTAAKTWRYRPASVDGAPVKYRKAVQVTIKPQGRS